MVFTEKLEFLSNFSRTKNSGGEAPRRFLSFAPTRRKLQKKEEIEENYT